MMPALLPAASYVNLYGLLRQPLLSGLANPTVKPAEPLLLDGTNPTVELLNPYTLIRNYDPLPLLV